MKIAIVHNQVFATEGIDSILSANGTFEIVFTAGAGAEALKKLSFLEDNSLPDIIVLPSALKGMSSRELVMFLKVTYRTIQVLILSATDSEASLGSWLVDGFSVLVPGYEHPREIIEALQVISTGELYFPRHLSDSTISRIGSGRWKTTLTTKEVEFLRYCCQDLAYKEIAAHMQLSERTVHHYRDSLFLKLNVKTKTGLALYAISAGFVSF